MQECTEFNANKSLLKYYERLIEFARQTRDPLTYLRFIGITQNLTHEFYQVKVGKLFRDLIKHKSKSNKTKQVILNTFQAVIDSQTRSEIGNLYMDAVQGLNSIGMHIKENRDDYCTDTAKVEFMKIQHLIDIKMIGNGHKSQIFEDGNPYLWVHAKRGKKSEDLIINASRIPAWIIVKNESREYDIYNRDLLIQMNVNKLLKGGFKAYKSCIFNVTRNAEWEFDPYTNLSIDEMKEIIKKRKKLGITQMEIYSLYNHSNMTTNFSIDFSEVGINANYMHQHISPIPFQVFDLFRVINAEKMPAVEDTFSESSINTSLLKHPQDHVDRLIQEIIDVANNYPNGKIYATLYRLAKTSKIASALAYAANKGLEVNILIELKARFDEENNIKYAEMLKEAGCNIIYGPSDVKVHGKILLIIGDDDKRLCHIGTGNYNEDTMKQYIDYGYLTTDSDICNDAIKIFNPLRDPNFNFEKYDPLLEKIISGMVNTETTIVNLIREEKEKKEKGKIRLILNGINNKIIIKELCEAAEVGVDVKLCIRGICTFYHPKVKIYSVVGKYLEHARIYQFGDKICIGSCDFLDRNIYERVEIIVPIQEDDKEAITHLKLVIQEYFQDIFNQYFPYTLKRRFVLQEDGTYIEG